MIPPAPSSTFRIRRASPTLSTIVTLLTLGTMARAAWGQSALPGPESPPPASTDAPADPSAGTASPAPAAAVPPATAVLAPEISARLGELEQVARIAARKHELLEEEAAKRAKEQPITVIDDKGITIKSADTAYLLRIRGLLQVDGRFFLDDDVLQDKDTFLVRRFRPSIEGTLFSLVDYRFLPDFAGGQTQVMDAYLDIHPAEFLRLRVGKMKAPLGLERLQTDADLPFVERALDQNLSTTREIGIQLWGDVAGGVVNYSVGVYNGGADGTNLDADTDHAKDFIGRLFLQPFKADSLAPFGNLGIGISASVGNRKGLPQVGTTAAAPGLPSFRTAGQNTFFSYLAPSPDAPGTGTTFAHLTATHLNPQLYYYVGPFGVLGEYIRSRQDVQKGNNTATLTHQAAHATATVVVNGKNGYDGVTPFVPFDPAKGAWGALEIAVRWSWLKLDPNTFGAPTVSTGVAYADPSKNAREAQSWAAALNFVPRRSVRLAVDFEQTIFKGGAAAADKTVADRKSENLLVGRVQVNF